MRKSSSSSQTKRAKTPNRFSRHRACGSRLSADLAGRSVALADDIPAHFDEPLASHHKLIGRWVLSRETPVHAYTRAQARRHIERTFNAAVLEILGSIELADFRVAVLLGEDGGPPAIAVICDSLGQIDLGWIETSEAPIPWRAAAYEALRQSLRCALPIFGYDDLFEEISMYYWEGETDDESARRCQIEYQGADPDDLDESMLPSAMNARRPEWMIAANAAPLAQLPTGLRQKLRRLRDTHKALTFIRPERNAWHFDGELAYEYIPGIEECSTLPALTLVPFEQFARELDDIGRHGMELGFMDVSGICRLQNESRVEDWFASLRVGAQFLLAAQDLIQLDPANP